MQNMTHEYSDSTAWILVGVVLATLVAVALGLVAAGRRASLSAASLRRLAVGVPAAVAAWLALVTALAASGFFQVFDGRPPRMAILPLGLLVTGLILSNTLAFRRMLEVAPREWPIALQTCRLGLEIVLYLLFLEGRVPVQLTFEGRNFDVVVGLTAPLVAFAVRKRWGGHALVALWNVGGLVSLVNVMLTVRGSIRGLHVDAGAVSPIVLTTPPFVWIPAFVMPLAVLAHLTSLRQLLADVRIARTPIAHA
jgi:hypothetical protein